MRQGRFRQWLLFAIVLLGLIPQIVVLGPMPYMPFDALWDNADVAVLGNVTSIQSSTSGVHTIVEIEVEEFFILYLNESTVKIRIEGGEKGGMIYWVEGQPEFEVGERVFVFLNTPEVIKGDYEYVVYLMFQGKFSVSGSTAFQENGRTFEIPIPLDGGVSSRNYTIIEIHSRPGLRVDTQIVIAKPYDGIEFHQILIVALGVVLLSIFIVWLLSPN